jgi:flagellar assembly factor FliW
MKVHTTRFGELEVGGDEIYYFPEGLLGFGSVKRYFTLANPTGGPFEWLQAVEPPNLAFVVCDPHTFKPDYQIKAKKEDMELIKIERVEDAVVRVILVIPKGHPERMTANLQGPIVFNAHAKLAKQLVLPGDDYGTRYRVFPEEALAGEKA